MKRFLLLINSFFLLTITIQSQDQWIVYKPNNSDLRIISIYALAIDNYGSLWVGGPLGSIYKFYSGEWTDYSGYGIGGPAISIAVDSDNNIWSGSQNHGLTKFDGTTSIVYNTSNSELPHNEVRTVTIDSKGKIWAGTAGGVAIFDGTNWTVYNTSNSNLPHNHIWTFAEDQEGVMWVATSGGLAKSDGTSWQYFNTTNSGLPNNNVISVAIDKNNDKWIGTLFSGLVRFNNSGWTVFNESNSGLPANRVNTIVIDNSNSLWIGTTAGGVAKYDGSTWFIFNESNSPLPYNAVYALAIESNGNKWFGTYGGLAVYNENGVVSVDESTTNVITSKFQLEQNYPNPFNPETSINYQIPIASNSSLKVYDLLGREVATLVNEYKPAGSYSVRFNTSKFGLSSGVYLYTLKTGNYIQTRKMILLR